MDFSNIVFISFKNGKIINSEIISLIPDEGYYSIERRLSSIQDNGFDSAMIVFSEGLKWDIKFPMSNEDIKKKSIRLFQSI